MARARFRTALGWAFVLNWGRQGGAALITFVLAAMLGPDAFGTVALAQVYLLFIEMFQEQGLSKALIQRGDLDDRHLDTVFWTNIGLSAFLWAGSLVGAPLYARLSGDDASGLGGVIVALSLTVPINALTIVQQSVLQRDLDFRSLALRANAALWIGGAVGIGTALAGFGVWALVAQTLTASVASLALLWTLSRWRPRLRFDRAALRELMEFSVGALLARLAQFANRRGDVLVVGYLVSPAAVGLYRLAQRLMELPLELSTRSVQAVSFPAFARLHGEPAALRNRLEQGIWVGATLATPGLFVLAVLAPEVLAVIGGEWVEAAATLQLLCLAGVGRAAIVQTGPLLQAVGRPMLLAALVSVITVVGVGIAVLAFRAVEGEPLSSQIAAIAASRAGVVLLLLYRPLAHAGLALADQPMPAAHQRRVCSGACLQGFALITQQGQREPRIQFGHRGGEGRRALDRAGLEAQGLGGPARAVPAREQVAHRGGVAARPQRL